MFAECLSISNPNNNNYISSNSLIEFFIQNSDQNSSYCKSVPKSIFESSLVASTYSYTTPPSSNYAQICNHLDANLAQIDIETFRSEDINAVFLQQAGEDCASISKSIFEDSISLRFKYIIS